MTAQEKARQLVDMHINPFNLKGCSHPIHTLFESTAKQCALNTVDQILINIDFIWADTITTAKKHKFKEHKDFWQEVKHEIKKL
jgi:hypothetical protein